MFLRSPVKPFTLLGTVLALVLSRDGRFRACVCQRDRGQGMLELPDLEQWPRELNIGDFLREAMRNRADLQLAIIAWGGYGKPTRLKYLTVPKIPMRHSGASTKTKQP